MRDSFVKTLMDIAEKDKNVVLITGDLGFGVLKPFWEKFPDQFINAGIAEQDMTGFAAGMALCGKTVFTYSIGNFPTLRCIEQIRNDCAYHNANVKIVCVGGFGSAVAEVMATVPCKARLALIGLEDKYSSTVGSQKYLREIYGMSAEKIFERISEEIGIK